MSYYYHRSHTIDLNGLDVNQNESRLTHHISEHFISDLRNI